MPVLHLETESARGIGNQLQQTADSLQSNAQTLANVAYTLAGAWQGSSRDLFLSEFYPLNQQLSQLSEAGMALNQRLQREVDEWERVAAAFALLGVSGGGEGIALTPASWQHLLPIPWSLPAWFAIPRIGDWLLTMPLPAWLKERLFIPQPVVPGPAVATEAGKTRLGDLLEPLPTEERHTADRATQPGVPQSPPAPPAGRSSWQIYHAVPARAQGDLGGNAACAPTSVSMVLDYYHQLDPANRTASPEQLLHMLDAGDFSHGQGMSLSHITDELQDLGYQNIHTQVNASLEEMQQQLADGPVIATMRLNMKTNQLSAYGDTVHAVVITGISADEQTIRLNDPWVGKEVQLPLADFAGSWQGGSNGLYVIRP